MKKEILKEIKKHEQKMQLVNNLHEKRDLLKEIDNRLYELTKYYYQLDDKYKLNVLKDLKNKIINIKAT